MTDRALAEDWWRRRSALDEVLDRHLGPVPEWHPGDEWDSDDALDAQWVMEAVLSSSTGFPAFINHQHELAKLARARKLAEQLSGVWNSLDDTLAAEMIVESWHASPENNLHLLRHLPMVLAETIHVATERIEKCHPKGRKNVLGIRLVDRLRAVWEQRLSQEAPNSMTEAGPFADFMIDAFDALGSPGNPRAAIDAWRALRAKATVSE